MFDFARRAENRSSQARQVYKKGFDNKFKHPKRFEPRDWVYIDEPPVFVKSQFEKKSTIKPFVKRKHKKMGPYGVIRAME